MNTLLDTCLEFQKYSVLDEVKLALFMNRNFRRIGMIELNMEKYTDTNRFISLMALLRESELTAPMPANLAEALNKYESVLHENAYFDFTMIMSENPQAF